jgi:hypothetical protein
MVEKQEKKMSNREMAKKETFRIKKEAQMKKSFRNNVF